MRNDRLQLGSRNRLAVSAAHVVAPVGVAHDGPHDVCRPAFVADRLERPASVVPRPLALGFGRELPECHADRVGGAGQRPVGVEVVADVSVPLDRQEQPVSQVGRSRCRPHGDRLTDGPHRFRPERDYPGHARLAPFERQGTAVEIDVRMGQSGQIHIADTTVQGDQEHGPQRRGSRLDDGRYLAGGEHPFPGHDLGGTHGLLARPLELRPEPESSVDVLVLHRPFRKASNGPDESLLAVLVHRPQHLPVFLPAAGADRQGGRVVPEEVYRPLDAGGVVGHRPASKLAAFDLCGLGSQEQVTEIAETRIVVHDRLGVQPVQIGFHLLVVSLDGELRVAQGCQPFDLATDLGDPAFGMAGEFDPRRGGSVVAWLWCLVLHNQKCYVSSERLATQSAISYGGNMDCKSVIRRFESDLGLSEIPAVSGVSDTSNESANKPELPDESRTNGPLSCGLVVAFGFIAGYLRRYTPLPRPAAPIKRSPLPRSRKPIAKMSKRGQRRAAKWRESGMVAFAASGGMCVRCLIRPAMHRHHKRKRRAGDDTPGNCCPLCELCHCFVEEHPKEAAAEGFVVSVNQSPLAKGAAA